MTRIGRWMFALVALIALAGAVVPAEAQIIIGGRPHHRHHHRHYRHHGYRR